MTLVKILAFVSVISACGTIYSFSEAWRATRNKNRRLLNRSLNAFKATLGSLLVTSLSLSLACLCGV